MRQQITTERVQLSPIHESDTEELHQLWTQPSVRQYLWDDQIVPLTQTRGIVSQSMAAFRERRYGLWGVRLIGQPALIGFCGYWPFSEPSVIELIYGLSPDYWGQGIATEMAKAMLQYGFETCGFEIVHASADQPNQASIAVMQRLGMTFARQENRDGQELVFYQIERSQFQSRLPG